MPERRAGAGLVGVPTLDDIASDPRCVLDLPADAVRALTLRCASALTALAGANSVPSAAPAGALLLNADGVAVRLNVSRSWVEHNLTTLPARVSVNGMLRWLVADIDRWAANRPKGAVCRKRKRGDGVATGASASAGADGGSATDATESRSKNEPMRAAARRRS